MHKIDSISEILYKSQVFYKKNWFELAKIIGSYIIVYIIVGILMTIVSAMFESITKFIPESGYLYYSTNTLRVLVGQFITISLSLFAVFALPRFFQALDHGHKVSFLGEMETVKKHFWEFFLITLFVTGLVYGGFFALVVPGIFFAVGTMFYPYTASLEHKHGLNALISSYWETRDKKWSIFGRLFSISVILVFGMFLIFAITGISIAVIATLVPTALLKLLFAIPLVILLLGFFLFVFMPFSMIPQYMVYKNLKEHSHAEIDHEFHTKKKKMFKIFIAIGLTLYIVLSIISPQQSKNDKKEMVKTNLELK